MNMQRSLMLFLLLCTVLGGFVACEQKDQGPSQLTRPVQGAVQDKKLLKEYPQTALVNEVVTMQPIAGHHFNVEAPQKCGAFAPQKITPQVLSCQFTTPGIHKVVTGICDDAVTFCHLDRFDIKVESAAGSQGQEVGKGQPGMSAKGGVPQKDVKNFIINDTGSALARARGEGKLLFIDFYGIWCPPCNMLDEMVFTTPAFQAEVPKDFVLVALDADHEISWEWKDHFKVGGYPTVVIANANLEEIGRVVGYRPAQNLLRWIAEQRGLAATPITAELDRPQELQRNLRLGKWHRAREEYDLALARFAAFADQNDEAKVLKLETEYDQAKIANNTEKQKQLLRQLLENFQGHIEQSVWALSLADIDKQAAAGFEKQVITNVAGWLTSPDLGDHDYTRGDLLYLKARYLEVLGEEARARETYSLAADEFALMAKGSALKVPRGANLERASCLSKAGRYQEAKDLYLSMAGEYPREFTFNYAFARTLLELKDLKMAQVYADRAYENSYGDNLLRAAHLKATLLKDQGQGGEARQLIEQVLQQFAIPASTQVRTHRYIGQLRDLAELCRHEK